MSDRRPFRLESPASRNDQLRRQQHGAGGEKVVATMLEASKLAGLGCATKKATTVTVRDGERIFTSTSGADFGGHLLGGRAVYLETKHTAGPRFDLGMLRPSQREELARAHADGAAAVVVVLVGPTPALARVYVVPWRVVAEAIDRGAASLAPEELAPWRLRPGEFLLAAAGVTEGGGRDAR